MLVFSPSFEVAPARLTPFRQFHQTLRQFGRVNQNINIIVFYLSLITWVFPVLFTGSVSAQDYANYTHL